MAGIGKLLNIGAQALNASTAGAAVAGRNTANVNTPGYSRERVDLNSELGSPLVGGVRVDGTVRMGDHLLAARQRVSDGSKKYFESLSGALLDLEGHVMAGGKTLADSMASLFGGFVGLASSPMDPALRQDVITKAEETARSFEQMANSIANARQEADQRIVSLAQGATRLASDIARLNAAIKVDSDPVLLDKREAAARDLSELMGGQARIDSDGQMRFVTGNGASLVDGEHAAQVQAVRDPALANHVRIDIVNGSTRRDVTTSLTSGQIAGQVAFRDGEAAAMATKLDQLAFDFGTQINAVHRAGTGVDGATGRNFFDEPASANGAAAAFAVNGALLADHQILATAGAGQPTGDNSGVLALSALGDARLSGGGTTTFVDEAIGTVVSLGSAAQSAQSAADVENARADVLANLRDSISGVSLAEESTRLAQFQHASDAAARFIGVVNEMFDTFIRSI